MLASALRNCRGCTLRSLAPASCVRSFKLAPGQIGIERHSAEAEAPGVEAPGALRPPLDHHTAKKLVKTLEARRTRRHKAPRPAPLRLGVCHLLRLSILTLLLPAGYLQRRGPFSDRSVLFPRRALTAACAEHRCAHPSPHSSLLSCAARIGLPPRYPNGQTWRSASASATSAAATSSWRSCATSGRRSSTGTARRICGCTTARTRPADP